VGETEETAVAGERPINKFLQQRTRDVTTKELLENASCIGSATNNVDIVEIRY
jgi:hypothetical protein